jgi:hypothetical protein
MLLAAREARGQVYSSPPCGDGAAYAIAPITVQVGDWIHVPLYTVHDGVVVVDQIAALHDPTTLVGNNIAGVLYTRTDLGWQALTWTGASGPMTELLVKFRLCISDHQDGAWPFPPGRSNETLPDDNEVVYGVLGSDPISAVLSDLPDPGSVVDSLLLIGYPAAALPAGGSEGMGEDNPVLEAIAQATTTFMADASTVGTLNAHTQATAIVLSGVFNMGVSPLPSIQVTTEDSWAWIDGSPSGWSVDHEPNSLNSNLCDNTGWRDGGPGQQCGTVTVIIGGTASSPCTRCRQCDHVAQKVNWTGGCGEDSPPEDEPVSSYPYGCHGWGVCVN